MTITFQELFEPLDDERSDPGPRIRPHCARCGRWVPEASVVRRAHPDGPAEDDWSGTCSVHGERVDVVWDEG